jgi:hypothetical protein
MSRPVFGQRPAAPYWGGRAILAQCHEPRRTDADRRAGRAVPCFRCLAYTAEQRCHFTDPKEPTT